MMVGGGSRVKSYEISLGGGFMNHLIRKTRNIMHILMHLKK